MACVGYPSQCSDQRRAEPIEAGSLSSEAIKISSDPMQRSRAGCSALPSAPNVLEAQTGGIAPITLGPVTAAVVAKVPERPEEGFRTGEPERGGQLIDGSGAAIAEQGLQPHLQGQHLGGGLLASLHTGLVVGVDVDQFGVEANGPLEEGDQGAEGRGIEAPQGDGEALAATLGQGRAGALQKTLQEILGPLSGDRPDVGKAPSRVIVVPGKLVNLVP
jgi:hypothetical protein